MVNRLFRLLAAALVLAASPLFAQDQSAQPLPTVTVCGVPARPLAQPPAGSPAVVLFIAPCFEAQSNQSVIEPQTYLYYIQLKASVPSQGQWVPYTDATEKMIQDDFHRLWNTNFLDNLFVEVTDYKFPNGTVYWITRACDQPRAERTAAGTRACRRPSRRRFRRR